MSIENPDEDPYIARFATLSPSQRTFNNGLEGVLYAIDMAVPGGIKNEVAPQAMRFGTMQAVYRNGIKGTVEIPFMTMGVLEQDTPHADLADRLGGIASPSLSIMAINSLAKGVGERYGSCSPEEVVDADVNWRRITGDYIEQFRQNNRSLGLKSRPGEELADLHETVGGDVVDYANFLMNIYATAQIVRASAMLSGDERGFRAAYRCFAEEKARLDKSPVAAILNTKMAKVKGLPGAHQIREACDAIGPSAYLGVNALFEVLSESRTVTQYALNNKSTEMYAGLQIRQQNILRTCVNTALREALNPPPLSIDIETPGGETLHITGGTIVDVVREVKALQVTPEGRGEAEYDQPVGVSQTESTEPPKSAADALPHAQQLDFEILPKGGLRDHVQRMARAKQAQTAKRGGKRVAEPEISDVRMQCMEEIVDLWGLENVAFYTGNFEKRRKKKIEVPVASEAGQASKSKEIEAYDDFLLIVLKDFDEDGNLKGEHVIAESPFDTHEHSLFVLRHDVRMGHGIERGWDEIMKWRKDDVRAAGARGLQHISNEAVSSAELMAEKVFTLLTCSPQEFTRIEFHGYDPKGNQIKTRVRGGRLALRGEVEEPEK